MVSAGMSARSRNGHNEEFAGNFRLGPWIVVPSRNRISLGGNETAVEPKVMRVLELLISRPGEVLSRTDIENAVWPNAIIGDKTLTRAISELRKAFGDDAERPAVIETVARRGYRVLRVRDHGGGSLVIAGRLGDGGSRARLGARGREAQRQPHRRQARGAGS